jgi:hypothetical protein
MTQENGTVGDWTSEASSLLTKDLRIGPLHDHGILERSIIALLADSMPGQQHLESLEEILKCIDFYCETNVTG